MGPRLLPENADVLEERYHLKLLLYSLHLLKTFLVSEKHRRYLATEQRKRLQGFTV